MFNPLECKDNYSATSNNIKLVHCYIWYSVEGTGWGLSSPRSFLAVPNVTAHSSTASVPVLLYNDPLLYGFSVPSKWLNA